MSCVFTFKPTAAILRSLLSRAKPFSCVCGHCPHAAMTIKGGLENILRNELDPEIELVRVD